MEDSEVNLSLATLWHTLNPHGGGQNVYVNWYKLLLSDFRHHPNVNKYMLKYKKQKLQTSYLILDTEKSIFRIIA